MRELLLKIIAKHYEITEEKLLDRRITKGVAAEARTMLFYLSHKYISEHYSSVAKMYNRKSYYSIKYAVEQAEYFIHIKHKVFTLNLEKISIQFEFECKITPSIPQNKRKKKDATLSKDQFKLL